MLRRHTFEIAVVALYLVAFIFLLQRHEFWRDEIQAWLIARDSATVADLFHNVRYEGHPALWHLLLMPLTRISSNPILMQWFHAALAIGCVLVVVVASPLTRLERALFPFGFFTIAIYGVISRSYVLGFLLVLLVCAFWRTRRNPILLSCLLALLANVHILFAIVAVAFCGALVVDHLRDRRTWNWRHWLSIAIFMTGFAGAVATVIPPSDSALVFGWHFEMSGERVGSVFRSFAAVLGRQGFWPAVAGFSVLLFLTYRLRSSVPALVFLLAAVGGLISFFYLRLDARIIHNGVLFVALLAAVWLARLDQPRPSFAVTAVFGFVLAFHVIVAINYANRQARRPESYGEAVAHYIEERGWKADALLGDRDSHTSTVVGYLQIPRAYYLNVERWGSFALWDERRRKPPDVMDALARAPVAKGSAATLILRREPQDLTPLAEQGFVEVARFDTPSSGTKENYVIYRREAGAN